MPAICSAIAASEGNRTDARAGGRTSRNCQHRPRRSKLGNSCFDYWPSAVPSHVSTAHLAPPNLDACMTTTSIPTRRVYLLLVYAVCLLPAIIYGAQRILHANKNSPFEWVPATFAPRREYEEFRRDFGSGEVLIVSWNGCTVDSPILANVTANLNRPELFRSPSGEPYIDSVISGQEALRGLMAEPLELPRKEALARIRGTPRRSGRRDDLRRRHAHARRSARSRAGCRDTQARPHQQLPHPGRGPALCRPGDRRPHGRPGQQRFARPFCDPLGGRGVPRLLVVAALAAGALVVVGVSVYCEAATMALIHWCGGEMSALLDRAAAVGASRHRFGRRPPDQLLPRRGELLRRRERRLGRGENRLAALHAFRAHHRDRPRLARASASSRRSGRSACSARWASCSPPASCSPSCPAC